jgi:photosystem II stability/assembly factor-like uncharacterized protein
MPKPSLLILLSGLSLFSLAPAARATPWRPIGPDGGIVETLAYAPSASQFAYAGTFGGGVFRSVDGGSSWTAANNGLPSLFVQSLAVDPIDPAVVYAGTSFGLYVTTSGGAAWTPLPLGSASVRPQVTMVRIDPHPRILYAVANGGIFRSADGGAHWVERDAGLPIPPNQQRLTALEIDPDHPGTLYAGYFNSDFANPAVPSLYKTTDGGGHWDASTTLQAFQVYAIARDRSAGLLYAATSDGLMSTLDGGATWAQVYTGVVDPLVVAPSGTLYGYLWFSGVFRSADGGRTWIDPAPLSPSRPIEQVFALALDPQGNRLLAANDTLGVDALDAGTRWTPVNQGLRATDVFGLAAASTNPPLLFVATNGGGVFVSGDGGADFVARNAGLSPAPVTRQVFPAALAYSPQAPRSPVIGLSLGSVATTSDAGRHWRVAPSICKPADVLGFSPPSTIFVSSTTPGNCTGPLSCDTQISRDGGATFSCLDGPRNASAFLVDPVRPAVVYAAAGAILWKSTDRGLHFSRITDNLGVMIKTLASSPAARQTLYAGGDTGALKSVDSGLTWSPIGHGVLGGVTSLVVDPSNPARVYAAANISNGTLLGHGVFASHDAGATWSRLGDGLPAAVSATRLALDPLRHVLYAGTFGSGVWAVAVP